MDDHRFDQLTRLFTNDTSRRTVARLSSATVLGAFLAQRQGTAVAARCIKPGKKCNKRNPKRDTCCAGARCKRKQCRCRNGRVACGKTCCPKGDICAGGRCVVGRGSCPAGSDTCGGAPTRCGPTCACFRRFQGGIRCGELPDPVVCIACENDAQCRIAGFPAGSSCVFGGLPNCTCGDATGACVAPCGQLPPTA